MVHTHLKVRAINSDASSLGSTLEPAINCHLGVSLCVYVFINVYAIIRMDIIRTSRRPALVCGHLISHGVIRVKLMSYSRHRGMNYKIPALSVEYPALEWLHVKGTALAEFQ